MTSVQALKAYRSWKRQPAIGCKFARLMARKPERFGQRESVIRGSDANVVARAIAQQVASDVDDPKIQATTIVLPDVPDLAALTAIALALRGEPKWTVTTRVLSGTLAGDVVGFNMLREIPFADSVCPSEALILGPFEEFPNTRRAPIVALEVFVGVPPPTQPDGSPTTKGHLADARIEDVRATAFQAMWDGSIDGRRVSLGGVDDARAKAKVAFVIPTALAQSMGCLP